jgi:two-component system, NarL family, response regulator LiaR
VSTTELVRIRVLVVDDHAIVRRGVVFGLGAFDDIQVAGEAASGEEAIRLYELLLPDVVLMDIDMPGMDGIAATQRLAARHEDLKVLMLTYYADKAIIRAALRAGASGYLVKDVTLDELRQAIQTTYAGQTVLSSSATQALVRPAASANSVWPDDRQAKGGPAKGTEVTAPLTEREEQVLALVATGKSNEEIGRELIISRATVRFHVSTILGKLDVANRAEAAAVGQRCHLFAEAGEHPAQARRCGAGTCAGSAAQRGSGHVPAPAALVSARLCWSCPIFSLETAP